jgi:thiamine-phosphate pyrophosphorylase
MKLDSASDSKAKMRGEKQESFASLKSGGLRDALRLYAVTDRHWLNGRTLAECVAQAIDGGATFVQLREKNLDEQNFLREAEELKKLCAARSVPFVVNDNVMIAKEAHADGVHVGQSDMACLEARRLLGPDSIIGVSAQTVEQAVLAEKQGADYLGVGAVFATGSKTDADSVPIETLKEICAAVKIPVVAIGGINAGNMSELYGTGIAGISVISAIFANDDIRAATKKLAEKAADL